MAHFAEIDENNVVQRVLVVDDLQEHRGQEFLANDCGLGGRWIKTSYNAINGKRRNPEANEITNEPGFRKNFAGPGMIYDEQRDAFYINCPFPSWILDEETCTWNPPIPYPEEISLEMPIIRYRWNEDSISWDLIPE